MTLEFVKNGLICKKTWIPKKCNLWNYSNWKQASLTGRVTISGKPHLGFDLELLGPNLGYNFIWRFQSHQAAILCNIKKN